MNKKIKDPKFIQQKTTVNQKDLERILGGLSEAQAQALLERVSSPYSSLKEGKYNFSGTKFKIGVIGDTHLNSKYCRLDVLNWLYDVFEKEKVDFVLHAGDFFDGTKVYQNQSLDQIYSDPDQVLEYVKKEYPKKSFKTYFISGNHDESYLKKLKKDEKRNLCIEISELREDLEYLCSIQDLMHGIKKAEIKVGDVRIRVFHGDGWRPETISQPAQKRVNRIPGGKKPEIIIFGFYHTLSTFRQRGVEVIYAGCTQDPTPYVESRGWFSERGGWILDIDTSKQPFELKNQILTPVYK